MRITDVIILRKGYNLIATDYDYLAQEIKKYSKSAHEAGIELWEMVAICKVLSDRNEKDLAIELKKALDNLTKRNHKHVRKDYEKCANCCGRGYFGLDTDCRVCSGTGKQLKEHIESV